MLLLLLAAGFRLIRLHQIHLFMRLDALSSLNSFFPSPFSLSFSLSLFFSRMNHLIRKYDLNAVDAQAVLVFISLWLFLLSIHWSSGGSSAHCSGSQNTYEVFLCCDLLHALLFSCTVAVFSFSYDDEWLLSRELFWHFLSFFHFDYFHLNRCSNRFFLWNHTDEMDS